MRLLPLVVLLSACSFGLTAPYEEAEDSLSTGPNSPPPQDDESEDEVGGLPVTAVSLEGNLYTVAPDSMTVTEPPGLDALLDQVLTRDLLVYVERESASGLQLDIALAGENGRQDDCEVVRQFPEGDWSENPVFDVGPGQLDLSFGGHPAAFRDLDLSGVFDEYGFAWTDGMLSAQMDTRELAPSVGDVGDLCELVESLGGACEPCDDGEEACFPVHIENISGELVDAPFDPNADGC